MTRTTEELLKDAKEVQKVSFGYKGLQVISREHKQLIAELSAKLKESEYSIDFMQTWVRRINNKETTPEEFISVVSHYPSFKPNPPKKNP